MISQILTAFVAVILAVAGKDIYLLIRGTLHPLFSPLRDVPGPPPDNFLMGNLSAIIDADPNVLHEKWAQEYGPVLKYKTFLNRDRLSLMDTRSVAHVLAHSMQYQKPPQIRHALSSMIGNGLLTVEGDIHKQQRRVMNPAFGLPQIRELTSVFVAKSIQMRDIWAEKLQTKQFEVNPQDVSAGKIEVLSWLNKMTLDVIGLAGFGYSFDALNPEDKENELNHAMRVILGNARPSLLDIVHGFIPATRVIKSARDKEVKGARATVDRVSREFLSERKASVHAAADGTIERKDFGSKDLLSLLVRQNMAKDVPEDMRMTDEEVLSQIPTFLLAGHETTSTAVTWALFALSQNHAAQDKLRAEVRACGTDEPNMEILGDLSYLDCVVRETMRLYSPVSSLIRVATKDDVLPTEKEWTDSKGVRRSGIHVTEGDSIFVPILALNRSKDIWGEDAGEWKPERWMHDIPSAASQIPGIWGNSLAFSGGSRACIGYRFSVIEMKAIVFTLVRTFKFSMSVDPSNIQFKSTAVTRPHLKDKVGAGPQLPLWVSFADTDTYTA